MKPLAILVTGDPVPLARRASGSFGDMIRRRVGNSWAGEWLDIDVRDAGVLPEPETLAGIIVTGSSASVTEQAPWMLALERYLCRTVEEKIPLFGICFGHQLLGEALGGRVSHNPLGRQIGTVEASLVAEDPLIAPALVPLVVNATHRDAVLELPPGARLIGTTPRDPFAFVRFGDRAWGVQFHPEFDRTTMRAYITERRQVLADEGFDPDRLLDATTNAEPGAELLRRFVESYVVERR